MSASVIALLRLRYPAITEAAASDAWLESWLSWAQGMCDLGRFGASYTDGLVMLLAHRAYSDDPGGLLGGGPGAPGPVTSIRTLDQSVSWGASPAGGGSPADAQFATTGPGRDWIALRDSRIGVRWPW